ncbi:MAG: zinc-ribbon domain-containing protein [Bradyrhizobium sp.]|uniref:MJ0042-type zinc finger domain-containing protein n=1 Tax=Bradyrhizobium sp. TaxID=376 RepID=UPI001C288534|nr:MJ0042-type zinc finger domain-containing protein [Bradyrhizobium sp.]MBU6462399.1 zinc-ribbon domain-containing protein [Pseudomonadota bacterium]MDE2068929.1 zinc-ribbon domain-containing protein [Bradyrhizobium sp.]MDE2241989.1 zinc-ribbon domain-containing protein [Bradyrhizobium sp.]
MHIVCPHCTTSYAIDLATLGGSGRSVRCSRCKEIWLARPEDVVEIAAATPVTASASSQDDAADEWERMAAEGTGEAQNTPVVDSPSISADWPAEGEAQVDWQSAAPDQEDELNQARSPWLSRLRNVFSFMPKAAKQGALRRPSGKSPPGLPFAALPAACAAMGALVLALLIWRGDVVRLMPQTAAFYKMIGLEVNLRGLMFKDVKITRETVEGKPVLVVEGLIVSETARPVELPRLRFSVRDEQGAEVYAWNAVLEQAVLKPGERAWFKSRLASPPPEGRNIDVRFFNKRDIAGGST